MVICYRIIPSGKLIVTKMMSSNLLVLIDEFFMPDSGLSLALDSYKSLYLHFEVSLSPLKHLEPMEIPHQLVKHN